jgi:hypothetical protein
MWSQRHVADRVDRRTVILLPYRATALATATAHDGGGCGCIERAGATAGAASAVYRRNKREAILSRQRPSASDNCECQVARQAPRSHDAQLPAVSRFDVNPVPAVFTDRRKSFVLSRLQCSPPIVTAVLVPLKKFQSSVLLAARSAHSGLSQSQSALPWRKARGNQLG